MMQENTYFGLLGKAENFKLDGDNLTIYCKDEQVLVFEKTTADLAGSSWRLYYYRKGIWRVTPLPFTKITLTFDEKAAIARGHSGVNLYGFNYVLSGDEITVSQLTITLIEGLFPIAQQEESYLKLLETSERVTFSEHSLTITCSGGGELHFRAD